MRTDIAIDKLCNVAPVIADMTEKISKDEEFKAFMETYKAEKSNRVFLFKVIPILLKNYRNEIFEIMSVWSAKPVEIIKAQPFAETVNEIKAIWADEDFRSFFSSSSASENVAGV